MDLFSSQSLEEDGYRFVVYVSDIHLPYLKAFLKLWEKYAGYPILVVGFQCPSYLKCSIVPMSEGWEMPVGFFSIGDFDDYPRERWSDSMIKVLDEAPIADHFVFVLEDYYLVRPVNRAVISLGFDVMKKYQDVIRFDLTTDRLNATRAENVPAAVDVFYADGVDVIETWMAQYQMSTQAGIWNKNLFQELLVPGESPWDFELKGTQRLNHETGYRVFGTRQAPVRYTIAVNKGVLDLTGGWQHPPTALSAEDRELINEIGTGI